MFCIDWNDDDPFELLGRQQDDEYTRLEVLLNPCNYKHTMLGYQEDSIHPECVADLEEQMEYLGACQMLILVN